MTRSGLQFDRVDVLRPSRLSAGDITAWRELMATTRFLQRAFYAPDFALACERAHGRARVAIFRRAGTAVAFFPFQFAGGWHRLLNAGERIGGSLADHAGLIAPPGFVITPEDLLHNAGLGAFFLTNLSEEQSQFGLEAQGHAIGHVVDLTGGAAQYLKGLQATRNDFYQDTQRRLRRAQKDYGVLAFSFDAKPTVQQSMEVLAAKRRQYDRTGVHDVFEDREHARIVEELFAAPMPECRPVVARLTAGERTLAMHLGLMCRDVLSYWFPVYDIEAKASSPGRLLLWYTIAAAETHGIGFIDRGEGDTRAKQEFSTGTKQFGRALWQSHDAKAWPARALFSLRWRLQGRRTKAGKADSPAA